MGFEPCKKKGIFWEDAKALDSFIENFSFNVFGKKEHDFEIGFAQALKSHQNNFKSKIITQIDKETKVRSVFCFGKKHRPDLILLDDKNKKLDEKDKKGVIAVEIKFVKYTGPREAIGQCYFYRLKYKFVFLILIISEEKKNVYYNCIDNEGERDLKDILSLLAKEMNIFTYIVPAFNIKPGTSKCIHFFPEK